jgi:hypothetical protein
LDFYVLWRLIRPNFGALRCGSGAHIFKFFNKLGVKKMAQWSNRYAYTEANVQKYAPLTAGVYRLIYKKGDEYYVFYVGQSNNLQRRLLEHLAASEPDMCIKGHMRDYDCSFRFAEISSLDERNQVEREQIDKYDPSCNR